MGNPFDGHRRHGPAARHHVRHGDRGHDARCLETRRRPRRHRRGVRSQRVDERLRAVGA
nr:MAG TPA: hypothetical protein [Caudoviricetes sp.]